VGKCSENGALPNPAPVVEYADDPNRRAKLTPAMRAAGEIADVAVVLRDRAREFNLEFLAYLLDMAVTEALQCKLGTSSRKQPPTHVPS
jgi:hypothetical protein